MNMVSSSYQWSGLKTNSTMLDLYYQMKSKGGFNIPFDGSIIVPSSVKVNDDFCIGFAQGLSGGLVAPKGP
ncbi:TPA: hypothetical protein NIC52_005918, partial [Pseudomonas aeruginosa]|nr:hypothetical protein [Pseudomonas aeruginosa]